MTAEGNKLPLLPDHAVILAFGDSITFGTGATTEESYPRQLEKLIARRVVNAGVPGEDTEHGLIRLPLMLERCRPALLILCHGANDLMQGFSTLEASENIRKMMRMAQDREVPTLLVGVPYPTLFSSQPPFYAMIAAEFQLLFLRETLMNVLNDPSLRADHIHPNARGYGEIAAAIADLLRMSGAIP